MTWVWLPGRDIVSVIMRVGLFFNHRGIREAQRTQSFSFLIFNGGAVTQVL
jgi:hypothetical protein